MRSDARIKADNAKTVHKKTFYASWRSSYSYLFANTGKYCKTEIATNRKVLPEINILKCKASPFLSMIRYNTFCNPITR